MVCDSQANEKSFNLAFLRLVKLLTAHNAKAATERYQFRQEILLLLDKLFQCSGATSVVVYETACVIS